MWKKLADAGVVFVDADLTGIMALNDAISFPIALHEPVAAVPAYLAANNAPVKTVKEVAAFKWPEQLLLVDELPRNPVGKVLKRELRAPYWEGRERQVN